MHDGILMHAIPQCEPFTTCILPLSLQRYDLLLLPPLSFHLWRVMSLWSLTVTHVILLATLLYLTIRDTALQAPAVTCYTATSTVYASYC